MNVPLPTPPIASGSVHTYQSTALLLSSICVAALATPKRNFPRPDVSASEPIAGYSIVGPPPVGPSSPPQAHSARTTQTSFTKTAYSWCPCASVTCVMLGAVRIYLVRHGDAVPEEDAGSDRDRWLSPRGREAARVLGRLLREQGVSP